MKKIVCVVIAVVMPLMVFVVQGAAEYKIDIGDETAPLEADGWTGLNAPHQATGGSVDIDGVTFTLFDNVGSRLRSGNVANTNLNSLLRDFVYSDVDGGDLGLEFGGAGDLQEGLWKVDLYVHDVEHTVAILKAIYRENGVEHLVSSYVEEYDNNDVNNDGRSISFMFYSDGVSAYDIIVRDNGNNKNRLNAVRLRLLEFKIDINDAANAVTNEGWTAFDVTDNNSFVYDEGIKFAVGSIDGVQLQGTVSNPVPDALYGDYIYDFKSGANNEAVILFLGSENRDLFAGPWQSDLYFYDALYTNYTLNVGFRVNGSGDEIASGVPFSDTGPAFTYQFNADGRSVYDIFTRTYDVACPAIINGVVLKPLELEPADPVMVRYDMDDMSGDVSPGSSTVTTPEQADFTASGINVTTMSSITGWGMDSAANGINGNIGRNSIDGNTWWSRGSIVPNSVNTASDNYTEFTVTPTSVYDLDFTEGMMFIHAGSGKNEQTGYYQYSVELYQVAPGVTSLVDSAWSHVNDGGRVRPVFDDIKLDLSSVGLVEDSVTFRLYFMDDSGMATKYPVLDTVTVYGEVVPGTPPGTLILIQ